MIQLRAYQQKIVDDLRMAFTKGKRAPVLVAPTGSGKTVVFSYMAASASQKGKRVIILVHREELMDQVSQTLAEFGVQHGFVAAGRDYDSRFTVHVASVFALARRLNRVIMPDLFIVDESHHAIAGSTWGKIMSAAPKSLRIGVTATPERLSGEGLADMFDTMVLGPSVADLIAEGSLSKYRLFAPPSMDLSNVHKRMGDFAKNELAAAVDKPTITGDAVKHYRKIADGKRAVAFCVSIAHAEHVAGQFQAAGYAAAKIDGKMKRSERREIIQKFRDDRIKIVTSCDLISEGFDLPAIEVAILLRPTQSKALYLQQVGRSLRPYPGKAESIILDHAGNCQRHGLPDDEQQWSLLGANKKNKNDDDPDFKVKVCPSCFAAQSPGDEVCSYCGYRFEYHPRSVQQVDEELIEIDPATIRREKAKEQGRAQSIEDLVELGRKRGYARPRLWAAHVFRARQARKIQQGRQYEQ